jgi:hypothetical protein
MSICLFFYCQSEVEKKNSPRSSKCPRSHRRGYHGSACKSPTSHCRGPVSAPGYSVWDLQCQKSGTATGFFPAGTSDILRNYVIFHRCTIWPFICHRQNTTYISIVQPTRCSSFSNLFYFVAALYIFRTVFPPIIRSLRLNIQHQAYIIQVQPTAC